MQGRIFARRALRTAALTTAAVATLATSAVAQGPVGPMPGGPMGPGMGPMPIGLEVKAVEPATRTVVGLQHCVAPELAGKEATFAIDAAVDLSKLVVGKKVGLIVDTSVTPGVVRDVLDAMPCSPGSGPGSGPGKGGKDGPGKDGPGKDGKDDPGKDGPGDSDDSGDEPEFKDAFVNRVWKFVGEADGFEDGQLSMTVGKILNLPKAFADQDDDVVDEDAIVLVGKAKVYRKGKVVKKSLLDDAEEVRVHGKMLDPEKWEEDEDGEEVTTIRAKKIYILK